MIVHVTGTEPIDGYIGGLTTGASTVRVYGARYGALASAAPDIKTPPAGTCVISLTPVKVLLPEHAVLESRAPYEERSTVDRGVHAPAASEAPRSQLLPFP